MEKRIAELRSQIDKGGLREAMVRAALYVGMARQSVDERGFEIIRRMRLASTDHQKLTLAQFKAMVREQFFMLLIDEEAALSAIPSLLPADAEERQTALAAIREVVSASGEPAGEAADRMKRIVNLFDGGKPRLAAVANARAGDYREIGEVCSWPGPEAAVSASRTVRIRAARKI